MSDIDQTNWKIERVPEGQGTGWYVYCLLCIHATDVCIEGEGEAETVEGALADCLNSLVVSARKKNAELAGR